MNEDTSAPADDRMRVVVLHRTVDPSTGWFMKVPKSLCGEPVGTSYLPRHVVKRMPPAERKLQLCSRCNARFS